MIRSTHTVTATCDRPDTARFAGSCKPIEFTADGPDEVSAALTRAHWTERDGHTYCDLHHPDLIGRVVCLEDLGASAYTHLARGVWARSAGATTGLGIALEVQVRPRPIEDLAAEQGVKPIESIDDLAGPDGIPAEETDAFLAAIRARNDPGRDEVERRLRVATCTLRRARRLAAHWSSADGAYADTWHQASTDLHATLDGPDDEPGDPDRAAFEDLLGAVSLYVDWRFVTRQLTTEQRTLWADAHDAWAARMGHDEPAKADRWWER